MVTKTLFKNNITTEEIKQRFLNNLTHIQGRFLEIATKNDLYMALAYTVRDYLTEHLSATYQAYIAKAVRVVFYMSAEYLLGPQLSNNLINLDIYPIVKKAVEELGLNFDELVECEPEPGLGNGGLGRLAACYLDSLATLNVPAIGYGIHYEFGIFKQEIRDGWQIETTDKWLRFGNPWEMQRAEISFEIKLGGRTEGYKDAKGNYRVKWIPDEKVKSIPCDVPVMSYKANTAIFLRLWKAEATESFDFQAFNIGEYYRAVDDKIRSENITKVLYPNDEPEVGKKLRLQQQYVFVSSTLQDIIRTFLYLKGNLTNFAKHFVIQLNDTHPALAVPELMRLLIDEHQMDWDKAWEITRQTFCFTNHTILPEALERWPLPLFASVLPRHLEIIFEINTRFLDEVKQKYPNDLARLQRTSLIDESGQRYVRMANLACLGSHAINGVSGLHTEILKKEVLADFYELWPEKFYNVTNGVTQRRFLLLNNPRLSNLISTTIGDDWIKKLDELKNLDTFAQDKSFQKAWQAVRNENKKDLTKLIMDRTGIAVNPESIFDIQAKRFHEYKRQHLNVLHVVTLYNRLRANPNLDIAPRTFIFAGKAAPGYFIAKLIIKLICSVADMINSDKSIKDKLKVVFLPDFNVKNARWIYTAADLSEQISTAGKEASGTGNMKFASKRGFNYRDVGWRQR